MTDFTYESSRIKEKYHDKVASENAIMDTWWRLIDITDLFAEYAWLQITAFDLSQLGIGLLLSILPYEFKPYSIEFEYSMPSLDEVMQGIWANFEKIVYELEYTWTSNWKEFIETNFKPEFWKDLEKLTQRKARYGYSTFSGYIYDPVLPREYLTETYHKMRLIRTPDVTWKATVQQIGETVAISDHVTRTSILRLSLVSIAQTESFCLGLSVLGRSTLRGTPSEGATIPYVTPENELVELKYYTLDNLQIGFILGVTELGYAVLTPQTSTYSQKDGKENPNIVQHEVKKVRKAVDTLTLSTWAYSNYNKPEEMLDYHRSDKTAQYDIIQSQRKFIEEWVRNQIPSSEANPVTVRQYQNAVLQAITWKAKRHKWGFKPFKDTPEDTFKSWWLTHWTSQGLKQPTLEKLYSRLENIIPTIRDTKWSLGEQVKKIRRMRSGTLYI